MCLIEFPFRVGLQEVKASMVVYWDLNLRTLWSYSIGNFFLSGLYCHDTFFSHDKFSFCGL